MTRTKWLVVVGLVTAVGCAQVTPEQQLVNDAAAALGGRDRVQAVRTLTLEGEGTLYNLGQDMRPGASGQTFTAGGFTRVIDVAGARARTEFTRTPNFVFFQGPQPQRQVQGLDGEVGYTVAPNGNAARLAAAAARDRRAELYHHPIVLMRAALAGGAQVTNARAQGTERVWSTSRWPTGRRSRLPSTAPASRCASSRARITPTSATSRSRRAWRTIRMSTG